MVGTPSADWRIGLALALAGFALAVYAWRRAACHPSPLIDLSARLIKSYAVVNSGGSVFRISIAAPTFLLPIYFQVGLGFSAFTAGLLILAHTAGDLGIKAVTTQTLRLLGFRTILIATSILFAAAMASCALFTSTTPIALIVLVLFASGAFRSLQMTALSSLQFAEIPSAMISSASTLSAVFQQVVRGLGIAFAAILLTLLAGWHGGGPPDLQDFRLALVAIAAFGLFSLFWYVGLPPTTASEVSGHRAR
jgi:hypothetical protein